MPHAQIIRAVVWDLDDTLYPERQYVRSGYAAVGRHLRAALGTAEAYEGWLWRRFEGGRFDRAFDALIEHFGLAGRGPAVGELVRVYREHVPDIRPHEGVPALLERLRGRGLRLGLLSDGYLPAQRLKLQALGLDAWFDAVVFTEDLGREAWKPSAAGFEAVRERLGVEGTACAYVGDNPGKDFVAPNALGWRTVQYVRAGQLYAGVAAPPGGGAQWVVRGDAECLAALR